MSIALIQGNSQTMAETLSRMASIAAMLTGGMLRNWPRRALVRVEASMSATRKEFSGGRATARSLL